MATNLLNAAKNVSTTTKSNPVIRTKTVDVESIRMNSSKDLSKNIVNIEIPVMSGRKVLTNGELDESKRASSKSVIAFDVGSMTTKDAKYPGSTEAGTPATLHTIKDGVNTNAYFELDLTAIAHKSFDEKQATRAERGLKASMDSHDPNRDRIDVTQTRTTTHNGVAGIAKDGVTKNVAEIAAQAYILSAGQKTSENPSLGAYSKANIDSISAKFVSKYNEFIKNAVENGSQGVMPKNPDGTIKGDKPIEGTAFPALKDYGVQVITTKDGTTVLAMNESYKPAESKTIDGQTLGQTLAAMNKAFNAEWTQEVNGTYTKEEAAKNPDVKAARTLGNMIGLNSYAVDAYDVDTKLDDLGLIQPAMVAKMQPYASALTKAVNVATHNFQMTVDGKTVEDATPTQAYGAGVIDKADEIIGYGAQVSTTREIAQKIQTTQLNEIYNTVNGADLPSVGGASDGIDFNK